LGRRISEGRREIGGDRKMGVLGQINLEAGERKCIVVPYGDLFLCLLKRADANPGLIRLAIRNLQAKVIL